MTKDDHIAPVTNSMYCNIQGNTTILLIFTRYLFYPEPSVSNS